ncbi:Gfo/Idh/MocA family oxidoreductase [bacterium]|nr:Gfo/Idh/MocA family oxidoreductase [bacterium]
MTDSSTPRNASTRRSFIKKAGITTAAASIVTARTPQLFAAESSTIKVALVGCGGRGTKAASQAMSVPKASGDDKGPSVKLVAMADVFEKNLENSYGNLAKRHDETELVVPKERRFIGFDSYKNAMDCLDPGDIIILTTPCAFRWVHYTYAIEKGLHVFMEKPLTADAPSTKRMFALNEKAKAKNLKVGVGLMCRHCEARGELFDRIQNGEIGDITYMRAYRMAGPTGSAAAGPKPDGQSELMYQISNFHAFLWLSGGAVSDFLIHNIDESCWMKNDWPIEAKGSGGRHYRGNSVDQNFDVYSIEYTFKDGTKLFVDGRTMPGCHSEFASYAHGTKGLAVISSRAHTPAKSRIYSGHNAKKENLVWEFGRKEISPYQLEWNHLVAAIRNDEEYNEVDRGLMASIVTSMGRMAAHTGQKITMEEMMDVDHEFAPGIENLKLDSDSPLQPRADGKYPIPMPGLLKDCEYGA